MEIHLLDMGQTKYGDCLVITEGGRKILIDAGHPGDFDRITSQLRSVLNAEPPFEFDLIVVTHCHADHIGCMPRLVSENIITATTALVADEDLGFGRGADGISGIDAVLSPAERKLLYALQEEPADGLDDASLLQFIEDAATLEEKYRGMLDALQQAGTNILRYGKSPAADITALEAGFAEFGFKVLGPTPQHLAICAATIAASVDAVVNALQASPAVADDRPSLTSAYRHLLDVLARQGQSFSDAPIEDRPGVGAAKNDQSIVIRVAADG